MTSTRAAAPSFTVVPGAQIRQVLAGREEHVTRIVESAYRLHGLGGTVNPDSYFLRFADRPSSRIIALPASASGDIGVHGIKWISSFPENVGAGLPRASAVLILNDPGTGYPFACLESSLISAARTAASAALAASVLSDQRGTRPVSVGYVGAGPIAQTVHTYLRANGFAFDEVGVHDLSAERAHRFLDGGPVRVHPTAEALIKSSDLVVFATTAGEPHVTDSSWFDHAPLVLHVSLRDLSTDVIMASWNVTDDVEHCMKANTSLHLTEQRLGHRAFVAGGLDDVLNGRIVCPAGRTAVFSPFGLGVLDLAVGKYVHDEVTRTGLVREVPGFFVDHGGDRA